MYHKGLSCPGNLLSKESQSRHNDPVIQRSVLIQEDTEFRIMIRVANKSYIMTCLIHPDNFIKIYQQLFEIICRVINCEKSTVFGTTIRNTVTS